MKNRGKGWMFASSVMLALSIMTVVAPVISNAISNRNAATPFGTISQTGTCGEKLKVFSNSFQDSNLLFNKQFRDYFETQTGCIVEDSPIQYIPGNYAANYFPQITSVESTVLNATPFRVGGSFGSIPAWDVQLIYEVTIEDKPGWGLCRPREAAAWTFSGDWVNPQWPANAAIQYFNGGDRPFPYNEFSYYGRDSAYWSRYSVSFESNISLTDQIGPNIGNTIWICGTDPIFQNADHKGAIPIYFSVYLDPADLVDYQIPFYSWMGW